MRPLLTPPGDEDYAKSNGGFALACCAVEGVAGSPLASREHSEPPHPYRSPFERDRARVIHSRAFRRLAGKTQVFTFPYSDHFRSRLTHTMEVAQISRAIASALGLNEALAETLALAHDIGHPPFGHAGEKALDESMRPYGLSFDHNLHALRIVEYFELRYAAFRGLNLTLAVREGIVKHSRDYSPAQHPELGQYFLDRRPPLEAQLIDLADEIAYLTADLEDGFEAGILNVEHIRAHLEIFDTAHRAAQRQHPRAPARLLFNEALKRMLNFLVSDLIQETARRVRAAGAASLENVRDAPYRLAAFSPHVEELRHQAKRYLHQTLYSSESFNPVLDETAKIVRELFNFWVEHPDNLPESYRREAAGQNIARVAADYIAGMTDGFILAQHREFKANNLGR